MPLIRIFEIVLIRSGMKMRSHNVVGWLIMMLVVLLSLVLGIGCQPTSEPPPPTLMLSETDVITFPDHSLDAAILETVREEYARCERNS